MLEHCGQVIQQEDESGAFGHDSAVWNIEIKNFVEKFSSFRKQ